MYTNNMNVNLKLKHLWDSNISRVLLAVLIISVSVPATLYISNKQKSSQNSNVTVENEETEKPTQPSSEELSKKNTKSEQQNIQKQPTTANSSSLKPKTPVATTAPSLAASPVVETCNVTLAKIYTDEAESKLLAADNYHDSEMARIGRVYAAKGAYNSSYRIDAQQPEITRYDADVARISQEWSSKLTSINCSHDDEY